MKRAEIRVDRETRRFYFFLSPQVSGKSRPVTGCVMLEPARAAGATVYSDLVLTNGVVAKVAFESPLKLAKGMYYDVEARAKSGLL